jgi:hypothetical protein
LTLKANMDPADVQSVTHESEKVFWVMLPTGGFALFTLVARYFEAD